MISSLKLEIARILVESEAIKISLNPPFVWTSGLKAPIYCNNRQLTLDIAKRRLITDSFVQTFNCQPVRPTIIAGVATAGIPWACFLAERLNLPVVIVRPEAKKHGLGQQVEGKINPKEIVLVVEDLVSTGGSVEKAVLAITQETKASVCACVSIVSWQLRQSAETFFELGLPFYPLTDLEHILLAFLQIAEISQENIQAILDFRQDPENWYKKSFGKKE